jgi:sugar phosphate isomerase/epimerase
MFHLGLVSISFRKHSVEEILAACREAGLSHIEWGGDVHVPAGDVERAREVAALTREAGMTVAAYGSYYRLGQAENSYESRMAVLETAKALGTERVRIWGGTQGSAELTPDARKMLAAEAREFGRMAGEMGLRLCLECHNNTVTDTYESALAFLSEAVSLSLGFFWQPNQRRSLAYNIKAAKAYAPYADHLHVFHWDAEHRYPLAEGRADWARYLEPFVGKDCNLMLEFMHDDRIESLPETAATLAAWVKKYNK